MPYSSILSMFLVFCLAHTSHSIAINGATGSVDPSTGQRPFRQEFSTLATSGPAFDLYILSLQQFQQDDQSELLSYFQVSGESLSLCTYGIPLAH